MGEFLAEMLIRAFMFIYEHRGFFFLFLGAVLGSIKTPWWLEAIGSVVYLLAAFTASVMDSLDN